MVTQKQQKYRIDKYKNTPVHLLAELLGIDDSWQPGSGETWAKTYYHEKFTLEEYLQTNDTFWTTRVYDDLADSILESRCREVDKMMKKSNSSYSDLDFSFLTATEIEVITYSLNKSTFEET